MKKLTFILLFALALPLHAGNHVENLWWMTGTWTSEVDGVKMEEQWNDPESGVMLGMHRDITNGQVRFEFLRIAKTKDGISLFAQPNGAPATEFALTDMMERYVVFSNPKNTFPQRIIYELRDEKLCARIEGDRGAPEEWCWTRKSGRN